MVKESGMKKAENSYFHVLNVVSALLISTLSFPFLYFSECTQAEAILYNASPTTIKQYHFPNRAHYDAGNFHTDTRFKPKDSILSKPSPVVSDKVFQIVASDAIDSIKYSQPDIDNPSRKVPLSTFLKPKMPLQHTSPPVMESHTLSYSAIPGGSLSKPMRDLRYFNPASDKSSNVMNTAPKSDYKITDNDSDDVFQSDMSYDGNSSNTKSPERNFTHMNDNLVSVSSDAVLSYEIPYDFNESISRDSAVLKQNDHGVDEAPSLNFTDFNVSTSPVLKTVVQGITTQTSVVFNTHLYIDFVNETNLPDSDVTTTIFPTSYNAGNFSSESPTQSGESEKLSSGTVAGIVIAVLVCVTILSSAVIYLLYRKFNGKCTSVVESKFNSDNCGYLDDSLRSSIYLNNHIELPKESSEEMTSLDNDSFLNSLETMTIQNYWADNSKNTKV